ncbi:MAG: putative nucleotidyltransferase with HDIG domain [Candidatus Azotimanducaceae bacterium]|jgi:putative nucleotidyltransferase with HDIG domain
MIKKISSANLCLGMYVEKLNGDWQDHPFWRSTFTIKTQKEISLIVNHGIKDVFINTDKGNDIAHEKAPDIARDIVLDTAQKLPALVALTENAENTSLLSVNHSLQQEISKARKICESSKVAVTSMFQEARMGNAINVEEVGPLVDEITASVWRNPSALISVARLKTQDDYTYMHSVAVCALMIALGKEMGMSKAQVAEAGVGGLLHDLGKAVMPADILNKPGKLTEDEFSIMKSHPVKGYEILLEGGQVKPSALDITLHHHEKINGLGYPHSLVGENISVFARMAAICDVYDAVTSLRPYKEGWEPATSVKRMANWEGHFDKKIFQAFVKSIGIYPVGSLVRLASDTMGIVIDPGISSLLTPKVKVFFSLKSRQTIPVNTVDLASPKVRDRIVGVEDADDWGFKNLHEFWLEG